MSETTNTTAPEGTGSQLFDEVKYWQVDEAQALC